MASRSDIASLDEFTRGYMVAALWSSTDNSRDDGGDPLDSKYDLSDIDPASFRAMKADARRFKVLAAKKLAKARDRGYSASSAGHDFWLTRNGHGAGFWDRDELKGSLGEELSKLASKFGETSLYVGDDGHVHADMFIPGAYRNQHTKTRNANLRAIVKGWK